MTKTLQQLKEERAGCVQLRRARFTGTVVGIYRNDDAGLDDGDGELPYSTVCEDHSMIVAHPTLRLARHHAPCPDDWCEVCQSVAAGEGLPDWSEARGGRSARSAASPPAFGTKQREKEQAMTNNDTEAQGLIQTANGYLLCSRHARAWQEGGNDVSMWPANEQEVEQGGGECCDCLADKMQAALDGSLCFHGYADRSRCPFCAHDAATDAALRPRTECADCGLAVYRAMTESFGPTGSMHSKVVYRHEATGHITCPQRRSFPTMTVGGLYGSEYSGRTLEEAALAAKDAGEKVLDLMDDKIIVE